MTQLTLSRELDLARKRRYRENHRDELREKGRTYMAERRRGDPDFVERERERIRALCREQPEHMAAIRKRSYDKHAGKRRAEQRLRSIEDYGLTAESLQALYEAQQGRCAICREEKPVRGGPAGLAIDHDHRTGRVRGLLCVNCNQALGKFGDSTDLLIAAVLYLERSLG